MQVAFQHPRILYRRLAGRFTVNFLRCSSADAFEDTMMRCVGA